MSRPPETHPSPFCAGAGASTRASAGIAAGMASMPTAGRIDPRRRQLALAAAAGGLGSLLPAVALAQAPRSPTPGATAVPVKATPVAQGLEHPWGMVFLPDRRLLVTERVGRMRIVGLDGSLGRGLRGVPAVLARGQGGLLDVALSPAFDQDRLVFFSYSETGRGGAGTAVARGRLEGDGLAGVDVIWRQTPKVDGNLHWGSRLVFDRQGNLFVTLGDRYGQRDLAQTLDNTIGKVIRIRPDGGIPGDNPFVGKSGAMPEVWSLGHRNMQGAAIDPADGALWTLAHGARGGDELDRPEPGKNYGWPVITYGTDYTGLKIGIGTERAGLEQPVYYWDPVIAPSGAVFYTGDRYPGWQGDLIVGSLRGGIVRLRIQDRKVVSEIRHLPDVGRVRDVVQGPDGLLYLAIDSSEAPILRLDPAA